MGTEVKVKTLHIRKQHQFFNNFYIILFTKLPFVAIGLKFFWEVWICIHACSFRWKEVLMFLCFQNTFLEIWLLMETKPFLFELGLVSEQTNNLPFAAKITVFQKISLFYSQKVTQSYISSKSYILHQQEHKSISEKPDVAIFVTFKSYT